MALAAGAFTVWGSGTAADAEVLAVTSGPTTVSAFGGVAAWSERDPVSGMYRLIAAQAGQAPAPLPIKPRAVPFDVDVGPGANREPVLVYSRCHREPGYGPLAGLTFVPAWARAQGCDIYSYDLRRGKEAKVPGASDRRVSEYLPSRWRNRLLFAVIDPRRPGMRALKPRLATIDLRRPSVVRYVPAGRHGFYPPGGDVRGNRTDGGPGISPDLPRRLITRPLEQSSSTRTSLPPCTISASRDGDVLYVSRRSTCPQPAPPQADTYEVIRQPLTRSSPS